MDERYFEERLPEVDEVAIIKMEQGAVRSSRKRIVAGSALVLLALFSFFSVRMQMSEQTAVVPTTSTTDLDEAAEIAELTVNFPTDEQLNEAFPLVMLAGERYQSMDDIATSSNDLWIDFNKADGFVDSYHRVYLDETPCTWSSLEPIVAVEVVANRYESADAAMAKFYEEAVNVNVEVHDGNTLLYPYTWRNHYATMDRHFDGMTGYGLDCAEEPKYMSWVSADRIEGDTIYYIRATVGMRRYNPILLRRFEKNMVEYIQDDWEMPSPNMLHYVCEQGH